MKVAIISSGFLPVVDGVTVALYQRLKRLSELGHQCLVLCPDYQAIASLYPNFSDYQGEILPGVQVVNLPSAPFMGVEFERNLSRQANHHLQQELAAFAPELVHVDEPDRLFLGLLKAPGVAYAKAHGIPCVGFYHTNFIDYIEDFFPLPAIVISRLQWVSMLLICPVFHAYDVILVSSPVAEARVRRLGVRNTVCDDFLGVDVAAFAAASHDDPEYWQREYGLDPLQNQTKLVFLGRLTPDKGWLFTLRAMTAWVNDPANAAWVSQVTLIVVGDGELRAEIKARLQALGLTVYCLGRISPAAVPALLANSDIHITTSEKETLGLTVLEAFAAGIPVIAPEAGGVATLLRHQHNGLLFEPQNVTEFGQALTSLLADPGWRQRLGQQGQKDVAHYSWTVAVENLLNTWQGQLS